MSHKRELERLEAAILSGFHMTGRTVGYAEFYAYWKRLRYAFGRLNGKLDPVGTRHRRVKGGHR